jgi:hypothetical protein
MTASDADVVDGAPEPASPRRVVMRQAVTISRVDPWTVLKLSLVLYFGLLLVVMLGLTLFWAVLTQLGVIESLSSALAKLQLDVVIHGGSLALGIFQVGLLNVILWSGINVFGAFGYNLVADVIGGLRVELDVEE